MLSLYDSTTPPLGAAPITLSRSAWTEALTRCFWARLVATHHRARLDMLTFLTFTTPPHGHEAAADRARLSAAWT